jgi:hypothetical protein
VQSAAGEWTRIESDADPFVRDSTNPDGGFERVPHEDQPGFVRV